MGIHFVYDQPRGTSSLTWPVGLRGVGPVGVEITVLEPQVMGLLAFKIMGAAEETCAPPEGVSVVRLVTRTERLRYPGVELPREEVVDAIRGSYAVFPHHGYEVRLNGAAVLTLRSMCSHDLVEC